MRLLVRALAALTPLALTLALATPSHGYLHVDWACSENMTRLNTQGAENGATMRDHRQFGLNAPGFAKHMTADNFASRWGGWDAYYRGWADRYTRTSDSEVICYIAHQIMWLNAFTLARVRVRGSDDGLHGSPGVTTLVTDEWDYNATTGKFNGNYRSADWDPCAGDSYC